MIIEWFSPELALCREEVPTTEVARTCTDIVSHGGTIRRVATTTVHHQA